MYRPVSGARSFDAVSGSNGNSRHESVTQSFRGRPPVEATMAGGTATSTDPGVTVLTSATSSSLPVLPGLLQTKSRVVEAAHTRPRSDAVSPGEVAPAANSTNIGWTSVAG